MSIAESLYSELVNEVRKYHPSPDFTMIRRAFDLANEAHKGQVRKSGEPYIVHPLKVAIILAELELDIESLTAGILHDVIEDTNYTYDDIVNLFSEEVAIIVNGVTKLEKISYSSKEELQADNFRKMLLAMAKDIRVILIKLADRLHNLRTLEYMKEEKQKEIAQESIDIYAPLAQRLGISKLKTEIEDLSFKYLYPNDYYDLAEKIEKKQSERVEYIERVAFEIKQAMDNAGIFGVVDGRPKHFFSIYKKMKNQNKTLDQIFDLFAIRAIVETTKDCYAVLGIVHDMYKPMPGRFKDYIAMPKTNMYQSIHNTLVGPGGDPFEIQIRTKEMHRTAEYGIAAHWKYKQGIEGNVADSEEAKLTWLREILEWQRELEDNREFMDAIKKDLDIYNDQVYVFTPKGQVVNLPRGSTPIDFAYSIHSAVGNKMVGAKINGKIVKLDYVIHNGDRIEIITSNNSKGPSLDWLNIVKSTQAKNKIKQWFKKESKAENVLKGKELLDKDARRKGVTLSQLTKPDWIEIILNKYGFSDWESICAAVGHGGLREGQIINRFLEEYQKETKKTNTTEDIIQEFEKENVQPVSNNKNTSGVIIKGVDNPLVKFSRCCNPVPGDEIIGFVTRGRGVTIHRTDCINIIKMEELEKKRLIPAEWDIKIKEKAVSFTTELKIICFDRVGLLLEILKIIADENVAVKTMNAKTTKNQEAIFNIVIEINGKKQLDKIIGKLRSTESVFDVERVTG